MAERLGQAVLELITDDSRMLAGIAAARGRAQQFAAQLDAWGDRAKALGRDLTAAFTLPIAGLATLSGQATLNYEQTLTRITSLVGIARDEVDAWRDDLQRISADTGVPLQQLAEGLFFVTSAGARGAEAIAILEESARGAVSGLGETATVADAATSAVNAYGSENLSAAEAVGILVASVREGKAEADSIAGALGQVLPIAAELGVTFDQVGASVAAMTRLGLDAPQAVTALRGVLVALLRPTSDAENALSEFGLSSQALREQLREQGLISTLVTLRDTIGDNETALTRVFPDIEGLVGVLNLAGENAENTQQIFAALAAETGQSLNAAFAATAEDGAFKLAQAQAEMNIALIELGQAILPVAIPLIQDLADLVRQASEWFASLSPETQEFIIQAAGIAAAVGPALVVLGSLASALGSLVSIVSAVGGAFAVLVAATGPIGLFIAAATAIIAAWTIWKEEIVDIVLGTARAVGEGLTEAVETVETWATNIIAEFEYLGSEVVRIVTEMMDAVWAEITGGLGRVGEGVRAGNQVIEDAFFDLYDELVGHSIVPDLIDAIEALFGSLGDVMVRPAVDAAEETESAFGAVGDAVGTVLDRMVNDLARGEFSWQSFARTAIDAARQIIEAQSAGGGGGLFGGFRFDNLLHRLGGGGGELKRFAAGGRPPVGAPYIVGENGPEIRIDDGPGTILPNHALGALGQRGGDQYFIDARGADREGLARLEAAIRQVNGSIEHRSIAAVTNARQRNPGLFR